MFEYVACLAGGPTVRPVRMGQMRAGRGRRTQERHSGGNGGCMAAYETERAMLTLFLMYDEL